MASETEIHNALIETKLRMLCKQLAITEMVAILETQHGQTIIYRYADQGDGTALYQGVEEGIQLGITKAEAINKITLYG